MRLSDGKSWGCNWTSCSKYVDNQRTVNSVAWAAQAWIYRIAWPLSRRKHGLVLTSASCRADRSGSSIDQTGWKNAAEDYWKTRRAWLAKPGLGAYYGCSPLQNNHEPVSYARRRAARLWHFLSRKVTYAIESTSPVVRLIKPWQYRLSIWWRQNCCSPDPLTCTKSIYGYLYLFLTYEPIQQKQSSSAAVHAKNLHRTNLNH